MIDKYTINSDHGFICYTQQFIVKRLRTMGSPPTPSSPPNPKTPGINSHVTPPGGRVVGILVGATVGSRVGSIVVGAIVVGSEEPG